MEVKQKSLGADTGAENVSRMPSGGQRQRRRHRGREVGARSSQVSATPGLRCLEHKMTAIRLSGQPAVAQRLQEG